MAMSLVGAAHANAPSYSWTGLYAGVNEGFIFNHAKLRSHHLGFTRPGETCNTHSEVSTYFPGIQLGYLHEFANQLVSGLEMNATFNTRQTMPLDCNCPINPDVSDRFSFRNQMQSTIKGRVGHALNWHENLLLPYITAGASLVHVGLTYKNEGSDYYAKKTSHVGSLIGAGIEWAFSKQWSLRAEYSYTDYGNTIKLQLPSLYDLVDPNGHARVHLSSNTVVVGINYWI